jgi:hypothetical protein
MDTAPRKIEILAPFSEAFELTKRILFQPFDIAKWFTIGFAAFLAGLADGTRANPGFNVPDFSGRAQSHNLDFEAVRSQIDAWLVGGVIAIVIAVVLVVMVLFMWLGSRGRFMFVDCIVHNRGAIEHPWREYRREGNSLFLWSLMISAISLLLLGLFALPLILRYFASGEFGDWGAGTVIYIIGVVVFFVIAGLLLAIITWFMVPVMYRQRCNAATAFMAVVRLIGSEPAPFILYVLFSVVVVIGGIMLSCLVTCLTCCLAAVPYIGTVILLPLYVFYYAYALLFLRQFGPEYDVWANIETLPVSARNEPPAAPPPVQQPPGEPPTTEPPPLPA